MTAAAIRDVWDSQFTFGLDGLCLDRDRLAALLWDPLSSDLIDRMNLRLHVTRSPHEESERGLMQITATADLKRVNQVLRDLVRQYQWRSMPEAIRYKHLDLTFEMHGDRVVDRGPLLKLRWGRIHRWTNRDRSGFAGASGAFAGRPCFGAGFDRNSEELSMKRFVVPPVLLLLLVGCSQRPPRVDLGVDLYLHPEAASGDDAILQAAIRRRIVEELKPNGGLVHVSAIDRTIFLSGSVKSDADREKAKSVAENIRIVIDGKPLQPVRVEVSRLIAAK